MREFEELLLPDVAEIRSKHSVARSRIDRLRLSFSALHADAFLVSHLPNIRYLCGFSGSAGLLLVEPSASTLFTDSRYTFQAREEVTEARIHIAKKGLLQAPWETPSFAVGAHRGRLFAGAPDRGAKGCPRPAAGSGVRWVRDGGIGREAACGKGRR